MADFSKFKIGNTSYNVKDAAAGKSLSVSGTDLSLKNAAGTAISTVTLPSGGGAYVILRGAYNSMFVSFIISSVVSDAGHTITTMQDLYEAVRDDGAAVYLVDETNLPTYPAEIIPLSYIYENALDQNAFDVGFVGVTKGWVSTRSPSDALSGTPWVAYTPGGGGSANTNIAFIGQSSGWPTINTIYYLPGTYKLTNQIGIKAIGYGQYGPYEKAILATGILIDDTYASAEDYLASSPAQGSLKIVAWFVVDANRIAKVTATCTYDGNGGYTVSAASATSVTYVGE